MSNITIRKANVILTVPEEQKDEYLNKGYDVVDSRTNAVIEQAIPKDVNALKVLVQELQDTVKTLKEENAKLKAELALKDSELPDEPDFSKVVEEDDFEDPEPEEAFTPINKRKSNKKTKE